MRKAPNNSTTVDKVRLTSRDLVVMTVYLLGGDEEAIDTEDVAKRVNELAPGRFTWVKYPDQINIELVRTYLSDAKKPKHGALLAGTGNTGWRLTAAGKTFASTKESEIEHPFRRERKLSAAESAWVKRERARWISSDAFLKHASGQTAEVSTQEAENLFRLDEYIVDELRERKVNRLVNAFRDDPQLCAFVEAMAKRVAKEPSHG